ncbi:g7617 [Coccomyxa elongata]
MEDPSFPWDHNTRPEHEAGLIQERMPLAHPNPECVSTPRRSVLSTLSLEAYMDMHAALTKGSLPKVQKVSAVERAMYKMNDLKQVLLMHGLSAGSKNKQDLLDVMEGLTLATPALHTDSNILGNEQATTHDQHVHLEVNAADLALLGWMKPQKASTVEAALGRPKQLLGLCNQPLAEGMTGPTCQSQEGVPMLHGMLAGQAAEAPGKHALPTVVFDLSAACAPDARAQTVCSGACPSTNKQTDERHEQLPLTPGQQGCTHFAASPDTDMDRHQMTTCPSQAAAAVQHITGGAPASQVSQHVCEAAQHQVLVRTMRRDDESTLSSAAATDTSQLISIPPLPANARLPEEAPGSTGTAQTPRTTNTIPNAARAEACDPSQRRVADNQVDDRAEATQRSHEHLQPAAEHAANRNDSAPIAVEEIGAAASNTGHCPTWVAEEVLQLAQISLAAPLPEVSKPGCLIGRSIGFVLLEDFDAGGDTVMRGIKTGRVLEHISDDHIEEVCNKTCTQQHSYHYVRLNRGGLIKQPGVGTKKRCLKVDFKLDLHPSLHQKSLAGLLLLNSTALQDAWMLLEPVVPRV